jgi:signal transduction histidine kinase
MSAQTLLRAVTQAVFLGVFILVAIDAVRRPRRATLDTALLFGALAIAIADQWIIDALHVNVDRALGAINGSLVMAMPYLLLRLLDDFTDVPRRVMRAAEAGLVLAVAGLIGFASPLPSGLTLVYVLYFVVIEGYCALGFVRAAQRSSGVTCRRMQAVAAGSALLGLAILIAGFQVATPSLEDLWTVVVQVCGIASGIAYFIGFAPPRWLRRAWQGPELRTFLGRAATLPRLPDTETIVRELERGAAQALGASQAVVRLWDEDAGVLRHTMDGQVPEIRPGETIGGRAFARQQTVFSEDAARDDPEYAEMYRSRNVQAVLAAPITAAGRRLGVLAAYAPRSPIFAEDDIQLIELLADQAAVVLESRALIDEAVRVQAREEATRLKDDFLSAAAHDLKTPLTTMVAQAQFLERKVTRNPEAPPDIEGIRRIVREAQRMRSRVMALLDASRVEQGRLLGRLETVDLIELARDVCERPRSTPHRVVLEAPQPVVGEYDPVRIAQLLDNLVENAIKYSPNGSDVQVRVWQDDKVANIAVIDHGIGIPATDLPHVFDRFHRGSNVDDRSFAGMGLGLFICRGIAEQHGGRITVDSKPGAGSTFHVRLPADARVLVS